MIERAMGQGLKLLNWFASSGVAERYGLVDPAQKLLYRSTVSSLKAATGAQKLVKRPKRPRPQEKVETAQRLDKAKGKALFDLTPSESQQLVQETMGRFAEERLRPSALSADEQSAPPEGFLDEAHELGLTMLAVPESLGGAAEERSVISYALAAEALAYGDMGLAVAALAPASVAHALVEWGTAEQQGTYLPSLVGDEAFPVALAMLEPQPMFDPLKQRTMVRREADGFVLDGKKALVPLAESAEWFLVTGNLNGRTQAFIVERDAPGLRVEACPSMGLRAGSLGNLRLDKVKLGADAMLGGETGIDAQRLIDLSRLAWCALSVGTCKAVLDYTKEYCNDRKAFGEPISNRQSVAFMIANIAIELESMRLLTLRAASRAEQGLGFTRETTLARTLCAEKAMEIGTNGVQLLGGHGFTKEHPVELWYRHLRAVGVMEGGLLL